MIYWHNKTEMFTIQTTGMIATKRFSLFFSRSHNDNYIYDVALAAHSKSVIDVT